MSASLSRRTILRTGLAAVGACLPVLGHGFRPVSPLESAPAAPSPDGRNLHLALAAYSRRAALTDGRMDLFDFIDQCADLGVPGVELTSYYFPEDAGPAYLHRLRRHAFGRGLTVSGTAIRNNFCLPPGPEKQAEIDHVRRWIDLAAELFAPHIRIFAGNLPEGTAPETGIRWVADGCLEVLDHAAERGIILGLENHHGITARVADHLAICDLVGEHPWFGINLDTGNYRTDAYDELARAAPRAVNVQVKVDMYTNDGEKVPADLPRVVGILKDAGYSGWVTLEYEGDADPETAIPTYLETLRALLA